jgi:hypothetical protein
MTTKQIDLPRRFKIGETHSGTLRTCQGGVDWGYGVRRYEDLRVQREERQGVQPEEEMEAV